MPRRKLLRSKVAKPTRKGLLLASLLHSTNKTANFNPLTSLARSMVTGKRKAYRTAVRPPKRGRTSAKKRATRGRKHVIGKDAGMLMAGKPPGITKTGACIRQSRFSEPSVAVPNRLWIGANSIQNERFALDLLVEGIMEYMLRRAGDTRTNKDEKSGNVSRLIFSEMDMEFVRRPSINGLTPGNNRQEIALSYSINTSSSSFNGLVYNDLTTRGDGSTVPPNVMFRTDPLGGQTAVPIGQDTFQYQIFDLVREGYYPEFITLRRKDTQGNSHEVMRDQMFGHMKLKMDIGGRHRFQNVTPASDLSGGSNGMNGNLIDANPLTGKMFTFSNLSPRMVQSWLSTTDPAAREAIQALVCRPQTWEQTKYDQISQRSIDFPDILPLAASPLRPRTLFSNCKTSGPVHFQPGAFKTFKTRFTYNGTLKKFLSGLIQEGEDEFYVGKYPGLGDSFMMCLRPTMKTTGDEVVTMAYDFEKIGKIQVAKHTHGTMATTNQIE